MFSSNELTFGIEPHGGPSGPPLVFSRRELDVQSIEGQNFIRHLHAHHMETLNSYPTIKSQVHTDKWAAGFLNSLLASSGTVSDLTYPDLYGAIWRIEKGFLPTDYLDRAEKGLAFLVKKARKRNLQDLIGNLRDSVTCAGVFEVMLAWALVSEFGESNTVPYPQVAAKSQKTADFGIHTGNRRIVVEAVCLVKDRLLGGRAGGTFATGHNVEADRFIKTCQDKITQRPMSEPLVLCVNQYTIAPFEDVAPRCVEQVLAWSQTVQGYPLLGIARFTGLCFAEIKFVKSRVLELNIAQENIQRLERAFSKISHPTPPDNNKPGAIL